MNSEQNTNKDGYTIEECVDFALMNEGEDGLRMSNGAAAVYSSQYEVDYEEFKAELRRRGWEN